MKQENIQRFKTGALALFMVGNMTLTGCTSQTGFMYKTGEDNAAVAYEGSYINQICLSTCVVAEVYNELLDEKQLYIVREQENNDREIYYYDLLDPTGVVFYQNNDKNNFLKLVKTTPVIDYIEALGLGKMKYSYEDMINILEEIKAVYEYSTEYTLILD